MFLMFWQDVYTIAFRVDGELVCARFAAEELATVAPWLSLEAANLACTNQGIFIVVG